MVHIISWNILSLKKLPLKLLNDLGLSETQCSPLKKWFEHHQSDIICFQETKIKNEDLTDELCQIQGYDMFLNACLNPKTQQYGGYSGVATYVRKGMTKSVETDVFQDPEFDREGRVLKTDHGTFILFNVYFPNSSRLDYKLRFHERFSQIVKELLDHGRHVIVAGDMNIAHTKLDCFKLDYQGPAASPEERRWMDSFLEMGFWDTFRWLNPLKRGAYTFWDLRTMCRDYNKGWRLDLFLISEGLHKYLKISEILKDTLGSDHCPISMEFNDLFDDLDTVAFPTPREAINVEKAKQKKIGDFFSKVPASKSGDSVKAGVKRKTAVDEDEERRKK